jgi:hypothetical protein
LKDANLRYADLEGANLRDASLTNADLRKADLAGAKGISKVDIEQQTDKVEDTVMPESELRSQLLSEAWEALEKDRNYPTAVARTQAYIDRSRHQARRAQNDLMHKHGQELPTGSVNEVTKERILARESLNGTATCYWIKGKALEALDQTGEATDAFREAQTFTYARAWDEDRETFWSPAEAAGARLRKLES